jgi:hemerythrin
MTTATFNEVDTLGIEIIDAQHRRFYEILGRLVAARASGQGHGAILPVLDDMVTYVDEHFGTEESYMREFGYDDYAAHRQLHAGFVRKIMTTHQEYRRGVDGLDDGLIAYLANWFTAHIRHEDPKYADLFRANGL